MNTQITIDGSKSSDAWTKANKHKQNLHMLTHVHVNAQTYSRKSEQK